MKTKKKSKREIALNAEIKRRNAKFAKMKPAQKRMAIAEDVLLQLRKNKYSAEAGVYCDINLKEFISSKKFGLNDENPDKEIELQTLLLDGTIESCEVCAIGSMFMSKVALGNKCTILVETNWYNDERADIVVSQLDSSTLAIEHLKGIFTEKQLRYIEFAFEGCDIGNRFTEISSTFREKIYDFHNEYETNDLRLKAIMENIIKNKGNFKI